jgi:hypothetical protein
VSPLPQGVYPFAVNKYYYYYIALNGWITANYELERTWEETFEGKLQELSRNLSGETKKNKEKPKNNRSFNRYSNWGPSEYKQKNLSL